MVGPSVDSTGRVAGSILGGGFRTSSGSTAAEENPLMYVASAITQLHARPLCREHTANTCRKRNIGLSRTTLPLAQASLHRTASRRGAGADCAIKLERRRFVRASRRRPPSF